MAEMDGGARYLKADPSQPSWDVLDLEAFLAADHRARVVWAFVETLALWQAQANNLLVANRLRTAIA